MVLFWLPGCLSVRRGCLSVMHACVWDARNLAAEDMSGAFHESQKGSSAGEASLGASARRRGSARRGAGVAAGPGRRCMRAVAHGPRLARSDLLAPAVHGWWLLYCFVTLPALAALHTEPRSWASSFSAVPVLCGAAGRRCGMWGFG